jgi:putative restriction endonuclease
LEEILQKYLHAFSRLKRGNTKYGLAPHKPILLLSILELMEKGLVVRNAFSINAELVGTFKENWQLLVPTLHHADFTQPFYYLQSEKVGGAQIWFLQAYPGYQINSYIKSVRTLEAVCAYGYFSNELFLLLVDQQTRLAFKHLLLDLYFAQYKANYLTMKQSGEGYLQDQISDVLNEPEAQYKRISINTEEDIFVRNGLFKQLVPKTYNNQCSFTGMQLTSTFNYSFVDACHIMPFSYSHNDQVTNGIALCPNLHRAFDRGLVSISHDYRIMVSSHLIEDEAHPYGLTQLAGKDMSLPNNEIHFPAVEGLNWHRENVFKG